MFKYAVKPYKSDIKNKFSDESCQNNPKQRVTNGEYNFLKAINTNYLHIR